MTSSSQHKEQLANLKTRQDELRRNAEEEWKFLSTLQLNKDKTPLAPLHELNLSQIQTLYDEIHNEHNDLHAHKSDLQKRKNAINTIQEYHKFLNSTGPNPIQIVHPISEAMKSNYIILELTNPINLPQVEDLYAKQMEAFKNTDDFKKLPDAKKGLFDIKPRKVTIDGKKYLVLTFPSEAAANEFLETLKKKQIDVRTVPADSDLANKIDKELGNLASQPAANPQNALNKSSSNPPLSPHQGGTPPGSDEKDTSSMASEDDTPTIGSGRMNR